MSEDNEVKVEAAGPAAEEVVEVPGAVEPHDDAEMEDPVARRLLEEVKSGVREWELKDGTKYRTRYPNSKEMSDANWEYSRAFNKALVADLPTNSQMEELLKKRGIWTDADDKEVDNLRERVGSLELILSKKSLKDKSKATVKMVEELSAARAELIRKTTSYQEYMSQTVEAKAEEARTSFLISLATSNLDDSPVWNTVDEFMTDRRAELVNTATYEYVTFSAGLPSDYVNEFTEVKFLLAGIEDDK